MTLDGGGSGLDPPGDGGPAAIRPGVAVVVGRGASFPSTRAVGERLARVETEGASVAWILGGPTCPDHDLIQWTAAAVSSTRSIRIVVGGVTWPPASWLRAAEDWATLDALSGGRIEVAVRPVPQAAPEAVLEDLQLVRRAWGSDPVHHASARRQVDGVEIHPKPAQPAGPPLWIRGEPGREALAVLLAIRAGAGLLVESIEAARSLLAASSRGAAVPQRLAVVVAAPDEDRAGRAPAALERARSARITGAVRFDSLDWAEAVRFDSITSSVGCEGARSL